jgi:hypothetical protein
MSGYFELLLTTWRISSRQRNPTDNIVHLVYQVLCIEIRFLPGPPDGLGLVRTISAASKREGPVI